MYKNKINKLRSLSRTGMFPILRNARFPDSIVSLDAQNNVRRNTEVNIPVTSTPVVPRPLPGNGTIGRNRSFDVAPIFQPTQTFTPTPIQSFSDNINAIDRFGNGATFIEDRYTPTLQPAPISPFDGRSFSPTVSSLQTISQTPAPAVNVQELARQLANDIIAENARLTAATKKGRIYSRFERDNDIIEDQIETITSAIWSSGVAQLNTFFTSSAQTNSQRKYYTEVYNGTPVDSSSLPQFSIAYGHALGSGSDSAANMYDFASQAVYYQYRQLLLDPASTRFVTQGSGSTDSIYAITFNRSCLKERIDPGNFEFSLKSISTRAVNATGSVTLGASLFTFIDDSSINSTPTKGAMGRVYNLVSGSLISGVYNSSAPIYYGTVYPEYGVIIADGNVLDQKLAFKTNLSSSKEGNNHFVMYHAMSGSALTNNPLTSDPFGFYARNSEKITSTHYFVRVKNSDYNFSNNPSYVTGSDGQIAQATFVGDPKTYITTVGLYNDRTELIAVAKLSKPLLKSYSREALIRVKLDF